jgi:dihydroorotate dehydrogenase electron transfer subunit
VIFDVEAPVVGLKSVSKKTFSLVISAPEIARDCRSGQFVMLSAGDRFLRRPISIAGCDGENIVLLVRIVGGGTEIISHFHFGDKVKVLGALGNGFPVVNAPPVLIGGGIGVAPLIFAAQSGYSAFFYGEKSAEYLIDDSLLPFDRKIATDDGSRGYSGFVTDMLESCDRAPIFACGPEPMLRKVSKIASQIGAECYLSLESAMACGFGVCQGCVVRTIDGYKRVCSDGPVFKKEDLEETL